MAQGRGVPGIIQAEASRLSASAPEVQYQGQARRRMPQLVGQDRGQQGQQLPAPEEEEQRRGEKGRPGA